MPSPTDYAYSTWTMLTGNKPLDSLLEGDYWLGASPFYKAGAPTLLTYSFITTNSYFARDYSPHNEYLNGFTLTSAQQVAVTSALSMWSAVANIQFTLVPESIWNVGDLRFGGYMGMDPKFAAWAYFPDRTAAAGDVWIGPSTDNPSPVKGSFDYLTFVHEIGHALGLKHPFEASDDNNTILTPALDDVRYTVMSYNDSYSYQPTTPMLLDILAIQKLYGANTQWQIGNNVYNWAPNQSVFETIWDSGGVDAIDGSNQASAVRINLNEGEFSQIGKAFLNFDTLTSFNEGLAIAYGTKIENAIGSAFDDTLIGNALDNLLNGMAGADTMDGGAGNDTYIVDNIGDVVIERGTSVSEIDNVNAWIDYTLGANLEYLNLVGVANLNGTGNSLSNRITGNAGNNILDGGAGADFMAGGTGNDTYIVDNLGDVISETSTLAGEIDTVRSSVTYTLGANLENLTLTGTDSINAIGNSQNNVLTGNDGNNQLNGGAGLDTFIGGKGNDDYALDQSAELALVQENANEGTDTLYVVYNATAQDNVVDLNLSNLQNVENVLLLGSGAYIAVGNSLNNTLTGNAGADILNGMAGADTMDGGAGNDSYYVDNIGDVVIERGTSAWEIDAVNASIDYTLGANLEYLNLLGTANLNGTGNSLSNRITGNAGNNLLDGGAGADFMAGGTGNDTYIVDNLGDVISETSTLAGEIDTVRSSVTYTLGANLENLTLTGSDSIDAIGNSQNNVLTGNDGNNQLNGGAGLDTFIGGKGNDDYALDQSAELALVQENANEGTDTLYVVYNATAQDNVVDLNLSNLQSVENVLLLGSGAFTAIGNNLNNTLTGNAGNNLLDGGAGADFMAGGTGNDTYIVDNLGDVISETSTLAGEIDTVRSSVTYTLGANLENLTLTGSDSIDAIGNSQNNVLTGNDGNNQLNGGAGLDTFIGGKGNDDYALDQSAELALVQENANEGTDTLYVVYNATAQDNVVDLNLSNLQNVENVLLLGSGAYTAIGNSLNNTLTGNAGADILNGMAGADTMDGGAGNDSYYVDNIGDVVIERGTSAWEIDAVNASIDYTLGANLEYLNLLGTANLNGTGNSLSNRITGNAGNNLLDGGAGADFMAGGTGNDTYIVDNLGDVISETSTLAGEIDTVRSSVTYTLGANLENLTLTGTNSIDAIGNSQNNVLTGNDGNNQLNGGAGLDTFIGGKGNDDYALDQSAELALVQENANEGTDTLYVVYNATAQDNVVDLNLSNLQSVENVLLLGSGAFTAIGNNLNNTLTGNAGNNILDGGAGADFMAGGTGNDTYIVDNLGDVISETSTLAGEIDTVRSSVTYTLGANLENLTLTGTNSIDAIGNSQNNVLTGNDGNNQLNGGAGLDTFIGGKGNDDYALDQSAELALVQENANEGTDTLYVVYNATAQDNVVDLNLSNLQNVENVLLLGSGAYIAVGNSLNNTLTGNAGADILNGMAGADTMDGGAGNDSYYVDNIGDVVIERGTSAWEIDAVNASIDYTLGANLEYLNLLGTANLNGTGNSLSNRITGNAGNNLLDGGAGADFMAGGTGNDTYIVDNLGDVISETSTLAGEIDTVRSSVTYTLGANLENLTLTGSDSIDAIGNSQNNVLTGNDGNNQLNGGAGLDTFIGGKGNDDYALDQSAELALVQENANEGTDTLYVVYNATAQDNVVDLNLSNLQNVENVLLLGSGAYIAVGNSLNNTLTGNAGADILNGMAGADTMDGGAGNDSYYVDNIGDVVIERGTSAWEIDAVNASIDYTLGANLEYLNLLGTANLNGTGNSLSNRITGNAGNNLLDGGAGADFMAGGTGNDTYIVDNLGDVISETSTLAGEIDTVRSSVTYTLGANLENLTLTGTDSIDAIGNSQNNVLTGNDGNNQLNGGAGLDTFIGGKGNDDYALDQSAELALVQENANEGTDTLYVVYNATAQDNVVDLNLSNLQNVENVLLLGSGAFTAIGNNLNNTLTGNAGNNLLDGGAGADFMAGGTGNDTYIVDNLGDVISETSTLAGEIDTVRSSVTYTLGANLENLTLTGSDSINAIGNSQNNVLTGNDGNNQLNGGAGLDTFIGGKGNDDYALDQSAELALVQENANEGTDTLYVVYNATAQDNVVDLNLSNLQNVENVLLLGSGAYIAVGNSLNNTLTGNAGADILNGMAGADTMDGGAGNDSYYVDNIGDVVIERGTSAWEIDAVNASIDYTLGANLEYLNLLGTANLNGTGNSLSNRITGNAGNNILDGGAGADFMAGGTGNDTYIVDNLGDVISETSTLAGEIDTVRSSVTYTLGANLENLTLTGTNSIDAIGNSQNNVLTGNDGNNQLNGGAGLDTFIGGKGNDDYALDQSAELALVQENANEGTDTLYVVYNATAQDNVVDLNLSNLQNVENVLLLGSGAFTAIGNNLNNTLTGNAGNNILDGGAGVDTLTGGAGADTFVFGAVNQMGTGASRDVITDFSSLQGDKIDLTKFDANLLQGGFNGFTFIGANDFTGAGQVRFIDHVLSGNVSGNAGADFEIQLVGVNTFNANDLVA